MRLRSFLLLAWVLTSCSNPVESVRLRLTFAQNNPYPQPLRWAGWPRAVPNSALEHECYLVSVSGPGISSPLHAAVLGQGYETSCLGWGVTTPLMDLTGMEKGVELTVPSGLDRRVVLFGTDPDGLECASVALEDQLSGVTRRMHILGDITKPLFKSGSVSLPNVYNPSSPLDQIALCAPRPGLLSAPTAAVVGELITLTGTGFLEEPTIRVGTMDCVTSTAVSSTQATCLVPSGALGTQNLTLVNRGGQSTLPRPLVVSQVTVNGFEFVERAVPNADGINPTPSVACQNPVLAEHDGQLWAAFWESDSGQTIFAQTFQPATPAWVPDDDAIPGINLSGTDGTLPALQSHNGFLYGVWSETGVLRGAKYQGGGVWSSADSGSIASVAYSTPSLVSVGGELFVAFSENLATKQARLFQFDGSVSWSQVDDSGSETDLFPGNDTYRVEAIGHANEVWMAWADNAGTSSDNVVVRSYDPLSTNWTTHSPGMSRGLGLSMGYQAEIVEHAGKIFVAWVEDGDKVFVSRYEGSGTWTPVEKAGGIGKSGDSANPAMVSFQGKLYLAFSDNNVTSQEVHVFRYESPGSWTAVSGLAGENHTAGTLASFPFFTVFNNDLYLTFQEFQLSRLFPLQIRVKRGIP